MGDDRSAQEGSETRSARGAAKLKAKSKKMPALFVNKKNALRNEVLAEWNTINVIYDQAVSAHGGNPPKYVLECKTKLDQGFQALLERIKHIVTEDDYWKAHIRGEELYNHRAFLLPAVVLKAEAEAKYEEVLSWGLSAQQSISIKRALDVIRNQKSSDATRRAFLFKIFTDWDFQAHYVEWVDKELFNRGKFFLEITALALLLAVLSMLVLKGFLIFPIVFAGACGAALSVLTKLPPKPTNIGDLKKFELKALSRFGTGLAASIVGYGLLAANIININAGSGENAISMNGVLKNAASKKANGLDAVIIIGVGIVFGFTERLITRLSGAVVAEKETTTKKDEKPEASS